MNKTYLALIQRNISIHLPFLRKLMYILAGLLTFAFLYLPA